MKTLLPSEFENYLVLRENAPATVEKYLRAVHAFHTWLGGTALNKTAVLAYKAHLATSRAPATVNGALSALDAYFSFLGHPELAVKHLRVQKSLFAPKERELSRAEYERLLSAARAKGNERLYLLMQTLCATGIRISELRFITVETVRRGYVDVMNKGKTRRIFLPRALVKKLSAYLHARKQRTGAVFITKRGRVLDRSNVWADMKRLCALASVARSKVFPHNLRHLFARTFYTMEKDIAKLADILGHSSIDTTRIYIISTGSEHRRKIERLGLVI